MDSPTGLPSGRPPPPEVTVRLLLGLKSCITALSALIDGRVPAVGEEGRTAYDKGLAEVRPLPLVHMMYSLDLVRSELAAPDVQSAFLAFRNRDRLAPDTGAHQHLRKAFCTIRALYMQVQTELLHRAITAGLRGDRSQKNGVLLGRIQEQCEQMSDACNDVLRDCYKACRLLNWNLPNGLPTELMDEDTPIAVVVEQHARLAELMKIREELVSALTERGISLKRREGRERRRKSPSFGQVTVDALAWIFMAHQSRRLPAAA